MNSEFQVICVDGVQLLLNTTTGTATRLQPAAANPSAPPLALAVASPTVTSPSPLLQPGEGVVQLSPGSPIMTSPSPMHVAVGPTPTAYPQLQPQPLVTGVPMMAGAQMAPMAVPTAAPLVAPPAGPVMSGAALSHVAAQGTLDRSSGLAVSGSLHVSGEQQLAFDKEAQARRAAAEQQVVKSRIEMELMGVEAEARLHTAQQATLAARAFDPMANAQNALEFEQQELTRIERKLRGKRCACFWGYLLICPLWNCCCANSNAQDRWRLNQERRTAKQKVRAAEKQVYLLRQSLKNPPPKPVQLGNAFSQAH